MSITQNIKALYNTLPDSVLLVAVSKTKPVEDIQVAYNAGQRIFGENKIQEMAEKYELLPKDIQWHMIGHVQRNKVKYMAPFVSLIHGVDSLKLLTEINKQAQKHSRVINCLLQIKIAEEDTKFGMAPNAAKELLLSDAFAALKNICITGVMGMATFTENTLQIEAEFKKLKTFFDSLQPRDTYNCKLNTVSMGMSGDYKIAIACGSTMVRVGSLIFGARQYH